MVKHKLASIEILQIKRAKKFFKMLETLGITEEEFDQIKDIPNLKVRLNELEDKVKELERLVYAVTDNKTKVEEVGSIQKNIKKSGFVKPIEEFDPNGK